MTSTIIERDPSEITYEDVWEAMVKIAEANPDYVYARPGASPHPSRPTPSCLYVADGEPSCLVGRGLVAAGYPVERLAAIERRLIDDDEWETGTGFAQMHHLLNLAGPDVPHLVKINEAQVRQDMHRTWGTAVKV